MVMWVDPLKPSLRFGVSLALALTFLLPAHGMAQVGNKAPGDKSPPSRQTTKQAPIAQTAVLYEEDQNEGQRYSGAVRWRTRKEAARSGASPQLALQAEIEIPEGHLKARWSMLQNDDPSFPASHVIEVTFSPLAGFAHGEISSLAGILMKQQEGSRGVPMTVQATKTVANTFLVALPRSAMQRNLTLLKENAWISIAIVFGDGHRAIVVLEKGSPGDRSFAQAFAAWK
jgi:hypothetical protein